MTLLWCFLCTATLRSTPSPLAYTGRALGRTLMPRWPCVAQAPEPPWTLWHTTSDLRLAVCDCPPLIAPGNARCMLGAAHGRALEPLPTPHTRAAVPWNLARHQSRCEEIGCQVFRSARAGRCSGGWQNQRRLAQVMCIVRGQSAAYGAPASRLRCFLTSAPCSSALGCTPFCFAEPARMPSLFSGKCTAELPASCLL